MIKVLKSTVEKVWEKSLINGDATLQQYEELKRHEHDRKKH